MLLEASDYAVAQVAVEPPHGGLASHRTLLHTTAWLSYVEMTELLLEYGAAQVIDARLGETGHTALQPAVLGNNWPSSDPYAERDPNGRPNHRSGREVAALLLEYGAHYDISPPAVSTPPPGSRHFWPRIPTSFSPLTTRRSIGPPNKERSNVWHCFWTRGQ